MLAERFSHLLDTLASAAPIMKNEVKEVRKAMTQAKRTNLHDRNALGGKAAGATNEATVEAESRRIEASYCKQLGRACVLDPAPVEAAEEELIEALKRTGAAGVRLYAPGMELNVLHEGMWQDAVVVRGALTFRPSVSARYRRRGRRQR